jgi:hypothetical protein
LSCIASVTFAEEQWYIWENPGIDFYSRIDDAWDAHINLLIRNRLSKYRSFWWFWRNCRGKADWIDNEHFDESIILGLKSWDYSWLLNLAKKKNISIQTDTLIQIGQCLIESYDTIVTESINEDMAISVVGNAGIYADGDKDNSDYDLLSDIERINTILFSNPEKYTGVKNTTKLSKNALARGESSHIWLIDPIIPLSGGNNTASNTGNSSTENTGSTNESSINLSELWLGSTCSVENGVWKITNVENMMDDSFKEELASILLGETTNNDIKNQGKSYIQGLPEKQATNPKLSQSAGDDFFHTMPCNEIFCIKVQINGGNMNLLGGGEDISIEGIVNRHIKILNPISWSDLSQQKMTNNSFQLPFLNIKFKSKIAWWRTYITTRPQEVKTDKREVTTETKLTQFEKMKQCADISVGLNSANTMSPLGSTYQQRYGVNTMNIQKTSLPTTPQDLEGNKLTWCLDLFLESGNEKLNDSLGTDIVQLQAFSDAFIQQIQNILNTGIKLDSFK